MDKNEKIVFGVAAALWLIHNRAIRRIAKRTDALTQFAELTHQYIEADYQEEIDKRFAEIVEHYEM